MHSAQHSQLDCYKVIACLICPNQGMHTFLSPGFYCRLDIKNSS